MFVQTVSMKSCECEVMTKIWLYIDRYASSHTTASKSKWFVGSSRSNKCGLTNSARARATRILHPPDMSLVGRAIICCENPRPWRIEPALASNVLGSISSSSS